MSSIVKLAQVIDNTDPTDMGKIKARILPDDALKSNEDVEYASPLLPKMFQSLPEPGELVMIIATTDDSNSPRLYVAPAVSNMANIEGQNALDALKGLSEGASMNKEAGESIDPKTSGALPKRKDVCVNGRKGSRLMLRDKSARLEAGTVLLGSDSTSKKNISFNTDNPSYIKLDYTTVSGGPHSSAVIVADSINLITHNRIHDNYQEAPNLSDPDKLINEETLEKLMSEAHPLPYGDKLIEVLECFRTVLLTHVHPQGNTKPCPGTPEYLTLTSINFNDILSTNIRID